MRYFYSVPSSASNSHKIMPRTFFLNVRVQESLSVFFNDMYNGREWSTRRFVIFNNF